MIYTIFNRKSLWKFVHVNNWLQLCNYVPHFIIPSMLKRCLSANGRIAAVTVTRARTQLMTTSATHQSYEQLPVDKVRIRIRKAFIQDASRLYEVVQAGYRGMGGWTTEHHLVKGERISTSNLEELIAKNSDQIFVACADQIDGVSPSEDKVVGCICAESAPELPESHAMLGLFSVDPVYQSKGIGSSLLAHATEFLREDWKCKHIVLWVIEQRSDIISWYQRKGFRITDQRRPFVFPDLALVDDMHFSVLVKDL